MRKKKYSARHAVAALLSAFALIACGGGGGDASGGAEPVDPVSGPHFPLTPGSLWIYQRTSVFDGKQQTNRVTSRIVGTKRVDGGEGSRLETVIESGSATSPALSDENIYVASATGIRVYEGNPDDRVSAAFDGAYVMRLPAVAGDSYLQYDVKADSGIDYDGDGISDQMAELSRLLVVGYEDLSVPAGAFANCLHQRETVRQTLYASASGSVPQETDFVIDTWYAPGIGRVRSVIQSAGYSSTSELISYRVGALTNDKAAPMVKSVTPGAGPIPLPYAGITLEFDEDLDPASFAPGSFTLFTPSGAALASTVSIQGRFAHLDPAFTNSGDGTYTIRLAAGIKDLVGNATTIAQAWTFAVDTVGPMLVSTVPADGANGVPLDTPIEYVFSKAMNPGSLTADSVRLVDEIGESIDVQSSIDGNRLTIKPSRMLRPGVVYNVLVKGLTDANGYAVPQSGRMFQTRVWFSAEASLSGGELPLAVAIGDINGDGINDLLMTSRFPSGLWVAAGKPDGTRADPVAIELPQLTCAPQSVAIGDLDGDGLADVVVSGQPCGIQVLYQSADHALRPSVLLKRGASRLVRLADIDGDGRLDLLSSGTASGDIEVWTRGAGGALTFSRAIDTGLGAVSDFETGDLSGQGRVDIVAAGDAGAGTSLALLNRQVDGSYAVTSLTGGRATGYAVALGDVDGDHLVDIVASTSTFGDGALSVFHRTATGYAAASDIVTGLPPNAVRVFDVDLDGRADVVFDLAGSATLYIMRQQADGTLAAGRRVVTGRGYDVPQCMAFGDLNGDGLPDLVVNDVVNLQLVQPPGVLSSRLRREAAARLLH